MVKIKALESTERRCVLAIVLRPCNPRTVDELDSAGMRGVAERIATGKLSVVAASETLANFTNDGLNKAPTW